MTCVLTEDTCLKGVFVYVRLKEVQFCGVLCVLLGILCLLSCAVVSISVFRLVSAV